MDAYQTTTNVIFDRLPHRCRDLNPTLYIKRDGTWCQTVFSKIRAKFSVIKARQEQSGEGNDLPFAAYVQKKDWHPKIMMLMDKLAEMHPHLLDFFYRAVDESVASEAGVRGSNPPPTKKRRSDSSELASALVESNERIADALRDSSKQKAMASMQKCWVELSTNQDLSDTARSLATELLEKSLQKEQLKTTAIA
eukprot:SAG31_NODE_346_length_17349_cov_9.825875_4_plen_195_part_00